MRPSAFGSLSLARTLHVNKRIMRDMVREKGGHSEVERNGEKEMEGEGESEWNEKRCQVKKTEKK